MGEGAVQAAGSVQASLSLSPSVVLGLSIGTSLGFLVDGSLQVVRLFNMVTEDFKGEIIQTARQKSSHFLWFAIRRHVCHFLPYSLGCKKMISPLSFEGRGIRLYFFMW